MGPPVPPLSPGDTVLVGGTNPGPGTLGRVVGGQWDGREGPASGATSPGSTSGPPVVTPGPGGLGGSSGAGGLGRAQVGGPGGRLNPLLPGEVGPLDPHSAPILCFPLGGGWG